MRSCISTVKSGRGKENGGHIRDEQSDGDEAGHKGYFPNPDPDPDTIALHTQRPTTEKCVKSARKHIVN